MHDDIEKVIADLQVVIRKEIAAHGLNSDVRVRLGNAAGWLVDASGAAHYRETKEAEAAS